MTRRLMAIGTLVWAMSACHSMPQKQQPAVAAEDRAPVESPAPAADGNAPPPSAEAPAPAPAETPPCVIVENAPKPAPKRKPKPVVRTESTPPAAPAAPPPPSAEASVKLLSASSASILGRKVVGQQGEDLGRLVDVLADAQGGVRIAVIEFGGFLGVGNRRIAVDWSLLKFRPEDPDAPIVLNADKRKLQGTPEYKGAEHPLALMAPEAPASPQSSASQ